MCFDPETFTHADELPPEPGWSPLPVPREFGEGRSFVSGDPAGDGLRIRYFSCPDTGVLHAKLWVGPHAEGPPGHAHGGSLAAVLDESMGFCAWANGYPVVAATISTSFRKSLPMRCIAHVEARVYQVRERKVFTTARIYDPATNGDYAEGEGLFIVQPLERFGPGFDPLRGAATATGN